MVRMNTSRDDQQSTLMPSMDAQTRLLYAQRVKEARQKAGRTQQDVASEAGVARNTLSSMEAGKRAPQMKNLWAVMLELGVRPSASEPEWLQEWWNTISPLARRVPATRRGEVFGEIIGLLHDAVRERN